jgi:hypothetical protein
VTLTAAATVDAEFVPAPLALTAPSAQTAALRESAAAAPAARAKRPKRARHRFARAKTIAQPAHRRSKEKR